MTYLLDLGEETTVKSRIVSARLSPEIHERAKRAASADRRSLGNWIALTIESALEDCDHPASPIGEHHDR